MKSGAYAEAYQFQIPWTVAQTGVHAGTVASTSAPLEWSHDELVFSSLKVNPKTGDLIFALVQYGGHGYKTEAEIFSTFPGRL